MLPLNVYKLKDKKIPTHIRKSRENTKLYEDEFNEKLVVFRIIGISVPSIEDVFLVIT
jgi:hypothetical protein